MLSPQALRRQLTAEPLQTLGNAGSLGGVKTENSIEKLLDALNDQEELC